MELIQIIILATVQGLTEFLPVSSSGHLLAVRLLFGISDVEGGALDAWLHIGTLLAVLAVFWRVWFGILRGLFVADSEGKDKLELLAKLAVATIPGAVLGYWLGDIIGVWLRSADWLAGSLIITAVLLLLSDWLAKKSMPIERATFKDAIYIGLAQVLALVPGISRSGVTIAAGRWRGLSREQAVKFSFLLSAPIIAGAGLHSLPALLSSSSFTISQLVAGLVVSFVFGFGAMKALLRVVEKISFMPFVVYLVGLAVVIFIVK